MIAGVASGIADYFDIDANVIRLLFILITIFGGSGILVYIVLWIFIPSDASRNGNGRDTVRENVQEMKETVSGVASELKIRSGEKKERSQLGFGIFIVIVGILFLLNNLGIFSLAEFRTFWPLLLIFLGIHIVSRNEE